MNTTAKIEILPIIALIVFTYADWTFNIRKDLLFSDTHLREADELGHLNKISYKKSD